MQVRNQLRKSAAARGLDCLLDIDLGLKKRKWQFHQSIKNVFIKKMNDSALGEFSDLGDFKMMILSR